MRISSNSATSGFREDCVLHHDDERKREKRERRIMTNKLHVSYEIEQMSASSERNDYKDVKDEKRREMKKKEKERGYRKACASSLSVVTFYCGHI